MSVNRVPSQEELIDLWLKPTYGISYESVKNKETFFEDYQVYKMQHDKWENQAIDLISKRMNLKKELVEKRWGFVYLNTSPKIIK